MIIETYSEQETEDFAKRLAAEIKPGAIVCLDGDLGVGKTAIAKGFAKGLGIEEPVVSPTFTIVHTYDGGRLTLYHFDVYRISDVSEMDEIGYEDCFYSDGVCLVEWSVLVEEIIPEEAIKITIEKDTAKGFDYRKISLEGLELQQLY